MAVNVKMGVDIGSFKQGIREGQQILKSLDAEMKVTEAEFKATGNAEKQMADKTRILTSQMNVQKGVIDQIQQAMKKMADAGIQPTDQAYQKLNLQLLNAQAAMMGTQAELNSLTGTQQQAASSADKLATSVGSIGKKLSLDQVISGIDKITGAMENALKAAVRFGEQIWDNIMESAQWGDDVATQAMMAQMSIEDYQRVMLVAATQGETSTSSLIKSWKKVKMNLTSDSDEVTEAFKELGVSMTETYHGVKYEDITKARDYMDVYWEIGEALMNMTDSAKQERLAQTLLGRSWQESIPMFLMGREAYEEALANQDVNTDDTVQNLATLNDKIIQIEKQFTTLKNELIGQLAPAFSEVADVISHLLHELNKYLQSEQGQAMLQEMGDSLRELFSGIKDISAEDVVTKFKEVFDLVMGGVEFIAKNKDAIGAGIAAAFGIWGTLKVSSEVLTLIKLFDGIRGLFNSGALESVASAGKSLGSAFGSSFVSALSAAAPWLTPLLGAAFSVGGIFGVQQLLKGEDYQYNDEYDPNRFTEEQLAILRKTYKGMLSASEGDTSTVEGAQAVAANLEAQLVEMAKAAGSAEKFFDLFVMSDGRNLLNDMMKQGLGYSGALYSIMSQAYGSTNWQQWGLGSEASDMYRNALNLGMDKWAELNATGGLDSYFNMSSIWMAMMGHFQEYANTEPVDIPVEPEVPEDAAAKIAAEIGTVPVSAELILNGEKYIKKHANGLPWVPYDGYLAMLHRGERVLTASENRSYTYNSNNYFGNVNLNNGQDIDALCDSIDRHNRRQRNGYGS